MKGILSESIQSKTKFLRKVTNEEKNDRSDVNLKQQSPDELEDEHKHWEAFFKSGCGHWFQYIQEITFSSTFCTLLPREARIIVSHWEGLKELKCRLLLENASEESITAAVAVHLEQALAQLASLLLRLKTALLTETRLSSVSKAFVKLSTRSPKDSKKILEKAKSAYRDRLAKTSASSSGSLPQSSSTARWRILCEEVSTAGAVSAVEAEKALQLLLDSERVYEDLEYALRGPSGKKGAVAVTGNGSQGAEDGDGDEKEKDKEEMERLQWRMDIVARAWDPNLTPQSEFRAIVWGGALTCLCQYFHPLVFEELFDQKEMIQADILRMFADPRLAAAVSAVGGHCIVDFAWLGPGKVLVIELNPFDGVCLGVFPASTGLFLWENPADRLVMTGSAPFEFRLRETPLSEAALKAQCNKDWRDIIYE